MLKFSTTSYHFYKIFNHTTPPHLFDLKPNLNRATNTGHYYECLLINVRRDYFKYLFFLLLHKNGPKLTQKL